MQLFSQEAVTWLPYCTNLIMKWWCFCSSIPVWQLQRKSIVLQAVSAFKTYSIFLVSFKLIRHSKFIANKYSYHSLRNSHHRHYFMNLLSIQVTFFHLSITDPNESQSTSGTSPDPRLNLQKILEILILSTQKQALVRSYQWRNPWSTPINRAQIDSELDPHRNATNSLPSQNVQAYIMSIL